MQACTTKGSVGSILSGLFRATESGQDDGKPLISPLSPASPSPPSQSWRTVSISGSSAVLLLFLPMDGSVDQRWIFLRKQEHLLYTVASSWFNGSNKMLFLNVINYLTRFIRWERGSRSAQTGRCSWSSSTSLPTLVRATITALVLKIVAMRMWSNCYSNVHCFFFSWFKGSNKMLLKIVISNMTSFIRWERGSRWAQTGGRQGGLCKPALK